MEFEQQKDSFDDISPIKGGKLKLSAREFMESENNALKLQVNDLMTVLKEAKDENGKQRQKLIKAEHKYEQLVSAREFEVKKAIINCQDCLALRKENKLLKDECEQL